VGAGAAAALLLGGCAEDTLNAGGDDEVVEREGQLAGGASVPSLAWAPCGDDFPDVSCAVAKVPLDYDQPRGPSIGIALAKVPAADPVHKIGTVFVNPGGPGGSGVGFVMSGFGGYLGALLQGRFDIVGFDPRGVASSEPLQCFESNEAEAAFLAASPLFPYLPEQTEPFFELSNALTARCLDARARITAHMGTADVARDMDLLRQAVGDRRLTYLGFSYGSYLGNTYANLFPNKVRALVIDGVLDPKLWSSGRQIESDRVSTAREFAEFLRLCDEADDDCPLSAPGGSEARYRALAAALREQPLVIDETFSYGYDYLVADTTSAMYAPEFWGGPDGYAALFAALADAVLGDPTGPGQVASIRQAIRERVQQASPRQAPYDNGLDSFYGVMCADTEYPRSLAEFRSIGEYAEAGSFFGPLWWWNNAPCAAWPTAPDRYTGPWTARTSAPVLVVGNTFDGVTGYDGAVASSKFLRGRLLTYAGWGHTAFGRSACTTDYITAYLLDGSLPPEGTVCPANPNPFVPAVSAFARSAVSAAPAQPIVGLPPLRPGR
jgi:pimeloyl-ACP methyl ester carboxylesterase